MFCPGEFYVPQYKMIKQGNLAVQEKSSLSKYSMSYERQPAKNERSIETHFFIQKITITVDRGIFSLVLTCYQPTRDFIKRLFALPWFSYGINRNPSNPIATLTFGLLGGTTLQNTHPIYLIKLLDHLISIEPLGKKTKMQILRGLSQHTNKIAFTPDMMKIGDLSSCVKQPELNNLILFREEYKRTTHTGNEKIATINVDIRTDGVVCITVSTIHKNHFLSLKKSDFLKLRKVTLKIYIGKKR